MPLKPDLGGFGESPALVAGGLGLVADVGSRQNQSIWSKFPSWVLQDTLLGCSFRHQTAGQSVVFKLHLQCAIRPYAGLFRTKEILSFRGRLGFKRHLSPAT